jgi:NADP-dependent 3-hydroxy acid dehydrogenase YdfG
MKFVNHQTTLHLSFKIKCCVDRHPTGVAQSDMLEADDVAAAIHFACTQPKGLRIIQVQMRTMAEALT